MITSRRSLLFSTGIISFPHALIASPSRMTATPVLVNAIFREWKSRLARFVEFRSGREAQSLMLPGQHVGPASAAQASLPRAVQTRRVQRLQLDSDIPNSGSSAFVEGSPSQQLASAHSVQLHSRASAMLWPGLYTGPRGWARLRSSMEDEHAAKPMSPKMPPSEARQISWRRCQGSTWFRRA
jgi:hypothetical protein